MIAFGSCITQSKYLALLLESIPRNSGGVNVINVYQMYDWVFQTCNIV